MPPQRIRRAITAGGSDAAHDDGAGFAIIAATLTVLQQIDDPDNEILIRTIQDNPFIADYLLAIVAPWRYRIDLERVLDALSKAGVPMPNNTRTGVMCEAEIYAHTALTALRNLRTLSLPQHPKADDAEKILKQWLDKIREKSKGLPQ